MFRKLLKKAKKKTKEDKKAKAKKKIIKPEKKAKKKTFEPSTIPTLLSNKTLTAEGWFRRQKKSV